MREVYEWQFIIHVENHELELSYDKFDRFCEKNFLNLIITAI